MLRTHYSSEITPEMDGKKVTVAGWARNIREHGSLRFLVIADNSGEMQITAKKGTVNDAVMEQLKNISKEDVVSIAGIIKKNEIAPGKKELVPEKIVILSRAETPLPLDLNVKSNLDTRLDWRFLDMRKPEVRAIFRIKDVIQRSFVRYLEENGFILVNTPQIVAAATEGGANLFPISYFEREAFLGQSPQLYKQMLMASGLDKVIIVVPVFRAEEHDTSFHLNEATQMDIEMSFVSDEQDALKYMDGVVSYIYSRVREECTNEMELMGKNISIPKRPIKQLTYDDALKLIKDKIKIKWSEDLTPEAQRVICSHYNPVIITKWPTDIRAFYAMPEPGSRTCRAYDMLIDGIEVCSGAQRIHDYGKLVKEMLRRKMNPKNFEFYLNAFRFGMPPHAGWSFGLERLTMAITGVKNIRECVLFPRDRKRLIP